MSSLRDRIERRGGRKRKKEPIVEDAEDEDRQSGVSEEADNIATEGGEELGAEEEPDDDNADEDFEEEHETTSAHAKPKAAPKRRPKAKPKEMSEDEEEEDPSSSEEEHDQKDDEDYQENSDEEEEDSEEDDSDEYDDDDDDMINSKRKAPARRKQSTRKPPATKNKSTRRLRLSKSRAAAARRAQTRKTIDSSSSSEEEEQLDVDSDDEFDFDTPARARRPRRSKAALKRKSPRSARQKRRPYKDVGSSGEDDDQEDHDSDEVLEETPKQRSSSSRTFSSSSKRTPSRASAAKAARKMEELKQKQQQPLGSDDDEVEEDEEEVVKPARQRKKANSDDEDYEDGIEDDEKEEDDVDDELDEDDESFSDDHFGVARDAKTRSKRARRVQSSRQMEVEDSQSFCDDDISEIGNNEIVEQPRNVARRRIRDDAEKEEESRQRRRYKKKYVQADSDEDDFDSENDAGEIMPTPTFKEKSKSRTGGEAVLSPRLQFCPSEVDAITDVPLPSRHVCFISPDGSSRQCFTLETLHKIATTTSHPQYRIHLGQQQLTFLQPPHFRSPMSDDLIDQIASRFGRDALILDSPFYNRSKAPLQGSQVDDLYQVHFGGVLADDEAFSRKKRDFALHIMGSRDIYPCPLCYTVAHHKLVGNDSDSADSDDDDGAGPIPLELKRDPISVLGSPDNEDFEVAASFCFKSMANVKRHLREEHSVDTSQVDNKDLYAKFKVRAPDGLLQRYLGQSGIYGDLKQGDMVRYWHDGNSELFIYLFDRMEYMSDSKSLLGDKIHKLANSDSDDSETDDRAMSKAKESWTKAKRFFKSFADRATDLWERISGPYTKATKQDMEDFIADEEEEEVDDDVHGHQVFDREKAMSEARAEKALAEYYEHRADGGDGSEYDDQKEKKVGEESISEEHDAYEPHHSSASEDDDWVKSIRSKQRKNGTTRGRQSFKKIGEKSHDSASEESADPDYDDPMSLPSSTPVTKKKAIKAVFEDSDDE